MTASPLIASYLRCCLGTAKVVKHRDISLRIRALAGEVVADHDAVHTAGGADQRPRFRFCDRSAIQDLFRPLQNLFAAAFHFLNPLAAWPGLAFVIPYVSYVIEIFVFDNGNISMHLCWLL